MNLPATCLAEEVAQPPIPMYVGYILSPDEITELTEKANAGDSKASVRLYFYYELVVQTDYANTTRWLVQAAEQGDVSAQYNLGLTYWADDCYKNIELAKYWFGLAADKGHLRAKERLREIELSESRSKQ